MTPTFIVCHAPFRGLFGYVAAHFFFAAALRFQGHNSGFLAPTMRSHALLTQIM